MISNISDSALHQGFLLETENKPKDALKCYLKPFFQNGVILFDNIHPEFKTYADSVLRVLNQLSLEDKFEPVHIKFFNPILKHTQFDFESINYIFQKTLIHTVKEFVSLGYVTDKLDWSTLRINKNTMATDDTISAGRGYVNDIKREGELIDEVIKIEASKKRYNLDNKDSSAALYEKDFINLLLSPVLTEGIKNNIIPNIYAEFLLTAIRKLLLIECHKNLSKLEKTKILPFLIGISRQCFLNEYIWLVSKEEKEIIKEIQENILKNDKISSIELCLLGSYNSLYNYKNLRKLFFKENFDNRLAIIIKEQLEDSKKESKLKKDIRRLHIIEDQISVKVREQYEDNPYPRWQLRFSNFKFKKLLNKLPYEDMITNAISPNKIDLLNKKIKKVLIAGCGTGLHPAEVAILDNSLEIDAVDLSLASIAYGKRQTDEMNIKNISWYHGDILNLNNLDKEYDAIECSGVLHHMQSPKKAFDILKEKLKPGGFFKVALYATSFRELINPAQEKIKEYNLGNEINAIRESRRRLINDNSKYLRNCSSLTDFYSTSEFRDLLMHTQEHDFNTQELKDLFTDEFEFLGFLFPDNSSPKIKKEYITLFPEDKKMVNLDNWNVFESKYNLTFRSMYQFWLQKK